MAEEAKLKERVRELEKAALELVGTLEPPMIVHIGSAHNRYQITYPSEFDNPVKRMRKLLVTQGEGVEG